MKMTITVEKCSHCGLFSPVSDDMMEDFCVYCGEQLLVTYRWYVEGEIQEREPTLVEKGTADAG